MNLVLIVYIIQVYINFSVHMLISADHLVSFLIPPSKPFVMLYVIDCYRHVIDRFIGHK